MNWKPVAIYAMVGQVVALGIVVVSQASAVRAKKRAIAAVDIMSTCTNSCVNILEDESLDFDEKFDRMSEEFQFLQLAIMSSYEGGKQ